MRFEDALALLKNTSPLRITVSGDIGSGKSTFAKHLALDLGIPRISVGDLMREEAQARGVTLTELGAMQEKDDTLDRLMDARQEEKSKEITRGIFEGRTSWHFVVDPKIRVFLSVDPIKAAERVKTDILNTKREHFDTLEEALASNERRKQSEILRYQTYYGINVYDPTNFDVLLDTSTLSIEDVYKNGVIAIAQELHDHPRS
ncbi:MAG: cytidylate kinase family protein [Patescibacteria group bacterium]|jgi:cytidylate kinase